MFLDYNRAILFYIALTLIFYLLPMTLSSQFRVLPSHTTSHICTPFYCFSHYFLKFHFHFSFIPYLSTQSLISSLTFFLISLHFHMSPHLSGDSVCISRTSLFSIPSVSHVLTPQSRPLFFLFFPFTFLFLQYAS